MGSHTHIKSFLIPIHLFLQFLINQILMINTKKNIYFLSMLVNVNQLKKMLQKNVTYIYLSVLDYSKHWKKNSKETLNICGGDYQDLSDFKGTVSLF